MEVASSHSVWKKTSSVAYTTEVHRIFFFFFLNLQAVKQIVEDLKVLGIPVYFWRWPQNVQCNVLGLDPDLRCVFRDADTLEELLTGKWNHGHTR